MAKHGSKRRCAKLAIGGLLIADTHPFARGNGRIGVRLIDPLQGRGASIGEWLAAANNPQESKLGITQSSAELLVEVVA